MNDIVNWDAVLQSLIDTWLPLLVYLAIILGIMIFFHIINKRR